MHVHGRVSVLLLTVVVGLAGCSSSGSSSGSKTTMPISTTTLPSTPCGRPMTVRVGSSAPVELEMAAFLGFTIKVDATETTHAQCVVPSGDPSQVIRLHLGDRIEYEANWLPNDPSRPTALSRIVSISSKQLPPSSGSLPTPHVLITLTAIAPGSATASYTDCSGTGC